jgi:hypothetical protein
MDLVVVIVPVQVSGTYQQGYPQFRSHKWQILAESASLGRMKQPHRDLDAVIEEQDGVLTTAIALRYLTEAQVRWRVSSGRWQKPSHGVLVAQSGPLNERQTLRAALLRAGPRAVLAGLTAARLDGFKGFDDKPPFVNRPIYLLVPYGYKQRNPPLGLTVVTHYSQMLADADVHPTRQPRRTRMARSLIDAAAWMPTDRGAAAILAAGVQQGLARVVDLRLATDRIETNRDAAPPQADR